MSTQIPGRVLLAAAALSMTALLGACGSSSTSTDSSATSAAASSAASAATSAAASTEASATGASDMPDESAACKQFDQLEQQIQDEGPSADVVAQLTQIEQTAKEEGDKEAEAAARELLANQSNPAGWDEALLQMEAVCGGERE